MQFYKNKHLVLAMFIAPLLAVIAYFTVDQFVSEKPHAAIQGNSYRLIAKSNCRYKSGVCFLENGDIKVKLRVEVASKKQSKIVLGSNTPLQNALVSFVNTKEVEESTVAENGDVNSQPTTMIESVDQSDLWIAEINIMPTDTTLVRLVVNISGALYYAETTAIFMDYETSFSRGNFSQ